VPTAPVPQRDASENFASSSKSPQQITVKKTDDEDNLDDDDEDDDVDDVKDDKNKHDKKSE
jgi:hypothetical protein